MPPAIIQLTDFKNIHFYCVSNLLTMPFFFGTAITKRHSKPSLSLSAGILHAQSVISFYSLSKWISVQSLSFFQLARITLLSSLLNLRFTPIQLMVVFPFIGNEKPVLFSQIKFCIHNQQLT